MPAGAAAEGNGAEMEELATKRYFTKHQACAVATELGIDFRVLGCDLPHPVTVRGYEEWSPKMGS
jgi:hypothetical protein